MNYLGEHIISRIEMIKNEIIEIENHYADDKETLQECREELEDYENGLKILNDCFVPQPKQEVCKNTYHENDIMIEGKCDKCGKTEL